MIWQVFFLPDVLSNPIKNRRINNNDQLKVKSIDELKKDSKL